MTMLCSPQCLPVRGPSTHDCDEVDRWVFDQQRTESNSRTTDCKQEKYWSWPASTRRSANLARQGHVPGANCSPEPEVPDAGPPPRRSWTVVVRAAPGRCDVAGAVQG